MKTTPKIKTLLMAGALLGMTSACQKESVVDNGSLNPATSDLKQALDAQSIAKEITFTLDGVVAGLQSGETTEMQAARVGGCGSITYDTLSSPKRITLDYGKTNCNNGGHLHRGKLILTYTGNLVTEGSVFTYSTEEFFVDNINYEGSRVMTNIGTRMTNNGNNIHLTVVDDFTVTYPISGKMVRNQNNAEHEWINGSETEFNYDDIFFINGTQYMTGSDGIRVSAETRDALRLDVNYPFMIAGSMKFQNLNNAENTFTVDYGYPSGERDNLALITYNDGTTEVVTLH